MTAQIADATTMGPVALTVADLSRSVEYYGTEIGLSVLGHDGDRALLGAGDRVLLELVHQPGARDALGYTGLFHFALLVPSRPDLARWLAHAARERIALTGLSDHFVSEALYLRDPDGHGIEIYADRPREVWEGQVAERMTTARLDVESLLGELADPATEPFDGMADGTTMGHVHLRVSDVQESVAFYRDLLGFEVMAEIAGSAAFFAAGGYHHHMAANTWESAGASAPPPDVAGLRHVTIVLPDDAARDEVVERLGDGVGEGDGGPLLRDPSGNALLLAVAD